MVTTFLIGNGFDVNLGLRTQYNDFYPTYFEKNDYLPDDNCIKKFCEIIKGEYDNWSDFEWAFAQRALGTHQEIGEIIANFNDTFAEYLQKQCAKCNYDPAVIGPEMKKFIFEPYGFLERREAQELRAYFANHAAETHTYNFVTFNYTDTLDNLLSTDVKNYFPSNTLVKNVRYENTINPILHLHGSMKENYIIIGIDALKQFKSLDMQNNEKLARHCVKSVINAQNGFQDKEDKFVKAIQSSNVICSYGLAFGETDKSRWDIISEWLRKGKQNKLIIFKYKTGFEKLDRMSKGMLLDAIDDAKESYLKLLGFEDEFVNMSNQIYVVDSAKALRFKLIEEEQQEKENMIA